MSTELDARYREIQPRSPTPSPYGSAGEAMVSEPKAPAPDVSTRPLWLAVIVLAGVIIGTGTGFIAWASGDNPFDAVQAGGASFVASVLFLIAVFYFMTHSGSKP